MALEVHEHYDADGVFTGTTVVTRESMWDDESRGRAMRLAEYEAGLCRHCGQPEHIAHTPGQPITVDSFICHPSRAVEIQRRADEAKHKDERPKDGGRWNDGRHYYAVPHED